MNKPSYPVSSCSLFQKVWNGYLTPNGSSAPAIKVVDKTTVTAAFVSTGTWDLTLVDQCQAVVSARVWPIDAGTDVVEVQVLSITGKVVRVRCRRAANDAATPFAVSNTCARIGFEITGLTTNSPGEF